jgi:MFS family permease
MLLFVAFLQATLGYTALQAGAATLPITLMLFALSVPSGALAQRIGPRIPLTLGSFLTGAGLLLMSRIKAGDPYFTGVMPALLVFGVGLATIITPLTATVLASVDARHAGIASGVNNSLSRLGQLLGVAALPLVAGLSGADFQSAAAMAEGFPIAMTVAGGGSFAAAPLAWTTISNDSLDQSVTGAKQVAQERARSVDLSCAVAGTPLSPTSSRQPTRPAAPTTSNR